MTKQTNPPDPLSDLWPRIDELCAAAERDRWLAPRNCVASARAAYDLARMAVPQIQADCALLWGAALNNLGRFTEALKVLDSVANVFSSEMQAERAAWYHSERVVTYTYRGALGTAEAALAHARAALADHDYPLAQARCDQAAGLLRLEQNNYAESSEMLQRALSIYESLEREDAAILVHCDLALALRFSDPQAALQQIVLARRKFEGRQDDLYQARCDYAEALVDNDLNRYMESITLVQRARPVLEQAGLVFMAGLCDLLAGSGHYQLNQYTAALDAYRRAQQIFLALDLQGYALLCDFNIATNLFSLNRYDEALELYQRVAEAALAEGRLMRAARCYTNMGLCHDQEGNYAAALTLHERACNTFREAGSLAHAALAEENLAGTLCNLGRYHAAQQHYLAARAMLAEYQMPVYAAHCDTHLANLSLVLKQYDEALTYLAQARLIYQQQNMIVHVATCDRETARALIGIGTSDRLAEALERLASARRVLLDQGLIVDAAACDVASGEAYLQRQQVAEAVQAFTAALPILDPAFPDDAWRVHFGLGYCALQEGDAMRALQAWRTALARVHGVRTGLRTERLSGGFFAARQPLYTAALDLALDLGAAETALLILEASKTQSYVGWQPPEHWRAADDPYAQHLMAREASLRRDINALHSQLRVLQPDMARPLLRDMAELSATPAAAHERLTRLCNEYEQIIEQLRLVQPQSLPEDSRLFSVETFRGIMDSAWSQPWAGLAYALRADTLTIFYLDAHRLIVRGHQLTPYDRMVLRQCTDPTPDYRELIYRGTLHGQATSTALGPTFLRHLHQLLIPPEVADLNDEGILIISPHGPLHALPFHALLAADQPLLAQRPIVYVPSLSALQSLLMVKQPGPEVKRVLACGLTDYGPAARVLPNAEREIDGIYDLWPEKTDRLRGTTATREALLQANADGQLAQYDIVHFAAHAMLDPLTPSQSRVLLYGEPLTLADILTLRLRARTVILSACDSALGHQQPGDEWMALGRAFFYAGARSVIASLWRVEDEAAGELMKRFYGHLAAGQEVAQALRSAQLDLVELGYAPYQWAAFMVMGRP